VNLVCDPATLVVAWSRVSRNRGSRTAGVDAETRRTSKRVAWSSSSRAARELRRERSAAAGPRAPDPNATAGCVAWDPTLKDRSCRWPQLVLEPIFESGFYASSYAYRPAADPGRDR